MQSARIAELLRPFLGDEELAAADLDSISMYIDILMRWNARMNLSAVRGEEEIVTRHFGESLFLARHLFPVRGGESLHRGEAGAAKKAAEANDRRPAIDDRSSITLADIGSGAGFPGIPIKLWTPQARVTLIESQHKKATFLKEVVRTLALADVDVLSLRAEDVEQRFDIVTLRAVERFAQILPIAARLVEAQGRLAILVGKQQLSQSKGILTGWSWWPEIVMPESEYRCIAVATRVRNHTN